MNAKIRPTRAQRPSGRRVFFAALLGALSVLSFAPFELFWLSWLNLGGLFLLLNSSEAKNPGARISAWHGAWFGAAFGFGLFITGVSWIYVSLSTFGGMPSPVAALATLLFCAFLSLYPACVGALFVRLAPCVGGTFLFAALWTLAEWLRGWIFTGFPWLAVGYAQTPPSPLAGFAPLVGVYGVSFLTALLAALLATLYGKSFPPRRSLDGSALKSALNAELTKRFYAVLLILALLLAGLFLRDISWTKPLGAPFSVTLLQGNIAQELKWRPEKLNETLLTYYRLARDNPAQLIVLPETALPAFYDQIPGTYLDALKALAQSQQGDLIFGAILGNDTRYRNAALSLGISGEQRYSKSHLVPFGEFIPAGFNWLFSLAHIPMSDFTRGAVNQASMRLGGRTLAINICYEDAFGEEIIRALPEANVLVNLSNVAWFGDSLAPAQHLQIAQMRALETGRMMLRATNTGMTAIVGVDGNVQKVLKPFTQGALRGDVTAHEGATPFVRYGNWPSITLASVLLAAFAASAYVRRRANRLYG